MLIPIWWMASRRGPLHSASYMCGGLVLQTSNERGPSKVFYNASSSPVYSSRSVRGSYGGFLLPPQKVQGFGPRRGRMKENLKKVGPANLVVLKVLATVTSKRGLRGCR